MLTTVHEALRSAVEAQKSQEKDDPVSQTSVTFRLQKDVKKRAEEICARHGTTLSAFHRQCTLALVRDYLEPANAGQPISTQE